MAKVWMYVVGANEDPNHVNCKVPWQVDDGLIFFGPCMPRIREYLRKLFLGPACHHHTVTEDLFLVGINAVNKEKIRKVVWAGRLLEVMTFEEAYKRLNPNKRFKRLCGHEHERHEFSPLHVHPLVEDGQLGYKHVGNLHNEKKDNAWVKDLVSNSVRPHVFLEGRKLILKQGSPWQVFNRDCCMLLENQFFASGRGIEFDDEVMQILREAQGNKNIDNYAVFGYAFNGDVNGLHGNCLKFDGVLANRFIAWLEARSRKAQTHQRSETVGPAKKCCT